MSERLQLGERVRRRVEALPDLNQKGQVKELTGTVVYLHPKGRYHAVRFDLRGGSITECYMGTRR